MRGSLGKSGNIGLRIASKLEVTQPALIVTRIVSGYHAVNFLAISSVTLTEPASYLLSLLITSQLLRMMLSSDLGVDLGKST